MSASKGLTTAAVVIGIIAIALSGFALATLYVPGLGPGTRGYQGRTQKITIRMGEGEIVQEAIENATTGETKLISEDMGGEETLTGEFHRWEPDTIVVYKGDTVELTVINPRSHAHSLVLTDFAVNTGRIPGREEQPNEAQRTVTKTFVADKAGVFAFQCGIPFDHSAGNCDPDHARMVGYLIVLEP